MRPEIQVFGLGKVSRLKTELKELQMAMVACAMKFSGAVSEGFEKFADQTNVPQYRILISRGQPTIGHVYLDQMVLAVEGLAFIFNLLSRSSFRSEGETLRETVYDQTAHTIVELFAKMIKSQSEDKDIARLESSLLDLIQEREIHYAKLRSVIGESVIDEQTVLHMASLTIAEEVGYPVDNPRNPYLVQIVRTELLRVIKDMAMPARIKRIEKLI
jgi:hypothetical protein